MGDCSSNNCNPCGPDYNAINQLATKTAAYARQANTYSVDAANSAQNAQNSFLEFNALYLGAFASAPTVDNEGNPLQEGALYFNSVSNQMFVWQGASWIDFDFDEFTPFLATGTPTARNLVTRTADIFNVKDFGAVGDGVADDTIAIQAAIDAADNAGGGTILFPSSDGAYLCSDTFTVGSYTTLKGDGYASSKIKWTGVNLTAFYPGGSVSGRRAIINKDYVAGNQFISVENLTLDFSLLVGSLTGSRQVIMFYNCEYTQVKNCYILTDGGHILHINSRKYIVDNNICQRVGTYGSSDGCIDQWDGSQDGVIINNTIIMLKNGGVGVAILVTAEGPTSPNEVRNFYIAGNKIYDFLGVGIWLQGRYTGCKGAKIVNNYIDGGSTIYTGQFHGIRISETNDSIISGNVITNVYRNGIRVDFEGHPTGTPYTFTKAINTVVSNNIITNCGISGTDPSISISNSNQIIVSQNIVKGTVNTYAISSFATITNYSIFNNYFEAGTLGVMPPADYQYLSLKWPDSSGGTSAEIKSLNNTPGTKTTIEIASSIVSFVNNAGSSFFTAVTNPTSATRLQLSSSGATQIILSSVGIAGTDVDLALVPQNSIGNGRVKFGTHVVNADAPISGYIEIKDVSGNLRKLAVIS